MIKIAIISDIHGNSWALEEVLKDIKARKPELIVNLGDIIYGPLDPKGTFEMLKSLEMIHISGNQDRAIIECIETGPFNHTMKYVLDQLNHETFDWLKSLPKTKILDCGVFLCHGTPNSDMIYLLEELNENYRSVNNAKKIGELLNGVSQKIVFCGHSHFARYVEIQGRTIINPGSVGLPAYDDNEPVYHKIENFHTHARYCLVEIDQDNIKIAQMSVPYDFMKAAMCAEKNNRKDWAKWLRTGRV
jgi:predicted phosphodiesterase